MVRYLIRRLLWAVVLFIAVTMVTYVIFFVIPANPAAMAAGKSASAADIARAALATEPGRLGGLRERLEAGLLALSPETAIFGSSVPRLPNTSAFATPGLKAETLLIRLDLAGAALSSGSACSSGKVKRSHVLDAMKIDPAMSAGALRASLGWTTCEADIDLFLAAYGKLVAASTDRGTRAAA